MRNCILCSKEIRGCFGYVLARDFIDYIQGRREDVRELCGKDVLRLDLISERRGISIEYLIDQIAKR